MAFAAAAIAGSMPLHLLHFDSKSSLDISSLLKLAGLLQLVQLLSAFPPGRRQNFCDFTLLIHFCIAHLLQRLLVVLEQLVNIGELFLPRLRRFIQLDVDIFS